MKVTMLFYTSVMQACGPLPNPVVFVIDKMVVVPTVSMKRVICVKECHFQTHI